MTVSAGLLKAGWGVEKLKLWAAVMGVILNGSCTVVVLVSLGSPDRNGAMEELLRE